MFKVGDTVRMVGDGWCTKKDETAIVEQVTSLDTFIARGASDRLYEGEASDFEPVEGIWGVWATPTKENPSEVAYVQWSHINLGSREVAEGVAAKSRADWGRAPQGGMWDFEARQRLPEPEGVPVYINGVLAGRVVEKPVEPISPVEALARALYFEDNRAHVARVANDVVKGAGPTLEREERIVAIDWARSTDATREKYLARSTALQLFASLVKK